MFAVFKTGGKQYKAKAGEVLKVERLEGNAGDTIEFGEVIAAGDAVTGLDKASVTAEIIEQARAAKVLVFKKKRRQNYRRKKGHRQYQTLLRIVSITGADGKTHKLEVKPAAQKPAVEKAPETKAKAETKKPAAKKAATKKA